MQSEQNPLADKILHRIEEEHVTPKPRWRFSLWNGMWWALWAIVILLGACVAAAMIFVIANADWAYRLVTHGTTFGYLIDALPSVWIALLALAIFVGYKNIRKTKVGYRYPITLIIILTLVGTLMGGVLLHAFGFGEIIERQIGSQIPRYRPTLMRNRERWMNPEHGFLVGTITEREADGSFVVLRSFDGRVWSLPVMELPAPGRDIIKQFDDVRVIGLPSIPTTATGTQIFHPCFAFPWDERHNLFSPPHRNPQPPSPMLERNLEIGSTTSCQGIPAFRLLQGMQDRQYP